MDSSVQLVLIGAIPALITGTVVPIVLRVLDKRAEREKREDETNARRDEKAEDRRREDEVAARLLAQQTLATQRAVEAAAKAAEAVEVAKSVAVKIDGLLAEKTQADIAIGVKRGAEHGAEMADQLAKGQQQGREETRAAPTPLVANIHPISVADKETQDATKRSADALERTADAAEKTADKADPEKK